MLASLKLDQLIPALAKARVQMSGIVRSKTNPAYHTRYASLDEILPPVVKALAEEGLVLMGSMEPWEDGRICITTRIMHISEQYIESMLLIPGPASGQLQKFGADVTYIRRYHINTMLELAADDDLDEFLAQEPTTRRSPRSRPETRTDKPSPAFEENQAAMADAETQTFLCSQILTTLKSVAPSETKADRERRLSLIQQCFGVKGWTRVEALPIPTLEAGYQHLLELTSADDAESDEDVPLHASDNGADVPQDQRSSEDESLQTSAEGTSPDAFATKAAIASVVGYAEAHDLGAVVGQALSHYPNGITVDALARIEANLKDRVEAAQEAQV